MLIALPPILIIGTLFLYPVTNMVFSSALYDYSTAWTIVNFILSLMGFVGMVGVFVFIPLGIHYLSKEDKPRKKA